MFLRTRLDGANHLELAAENRAAAQAQSVPVRHPVGTRPGCEGVIADENQAYPRLHGSA